MTIHISNLQETALSMGASFFGIADLSPAYAEIFDQGGEAIAAFPRAISIGIALQHSLVDPLPDQQNKVVVMNYRCMAYDAVNLRLDQITLALSGKIQAAGYRSLPVPASLRAYHDRLMGIFSNKLSASLAGLGWIGKSCLLVTPQNGPRVRWATVLTTAPLEPTGSMIEQRCGTCRECVDICPVKAFTGVSFRPQDPRSVRFDAQKCSDYFEKRLEEIGYSVCGLCLYVCPHGKMASKRLQ